MVFVVGGHRGRPGGHRGDSARGLAQGIAQGCSLHSPLVELLVSNVITNRYGHAMTTEPRAALDRLIAALEAHLSAAAGRQGEADPAVVSAYQVLADAFESYDEALYDAFDEVTPFVLYDDAEDAASEEDLEDDDLEDLEDEEEDDEEDDDEEDDDEEEDDGEDERPASSTTL